MGQKLGRATISPKARPFVNLPKADVYELWDRFNDIADGFGLNLESFQEVCCDLAGYLLRGKAPPGPPPHARAAPPQLGARL